MPTTSWAITPRPLPATSRHSTSTATPATAEAGPRSSPTSATPARQLETSWPPAAPGRRPWPSLTTCSIPMPARSAPASAPATAKPAVQPDFTCNTPGVCFFDGADFTGAATNYIPSLEPDRWLSLTQDGLTLPWGSLNNNSGSSVVVEDAQDGHSHCFPPNGQWTEAEIDNNISPFFSGIRSFRYVYIEYGNTLCSGSYPPPP